MDDVRMDMGAMAIAVLVRWRRIALVTVVLLVATYVVLMFVPKLYESTASVLVESRDNAFMRATNDLQPSFGVAEDTAVASQIELIKSRGNLLQVIETENLGDEAEFNGSKSSPLSFIARLLGRSNNTRRLDEIVLGNVAKNLTVVRERESQIVSVTFSSRDPELAARIANAIAATHVQRRAGLYLSDTADASQWLSAEIQKLRVRTLEAEAKVATYRVDNDLFVGANETSLLDQQLSDIATQITSAQERENIARSRAGLIRGLLEAGQPIDGVPDVRESVVVQQLSEEKARLQGERAQRMATLLPNHPDILALSAQISEINKQILLEGRQVADALEVEAKIEATMETSLRDDLTRLKIDASSATKDTVVLNELEREAKAQRDLLETYLLRYRDAASRTEINSALPDVRVISTAAASLSPASPKKALILAAVLIVSMMLQLGHILFVELVSGRALTDGTGASVNQWAQQGYESQPRPMQPVTGNTRQRKASWLSSSIKKNSGAQAASAHALSHIGAQIAHNGDRLILMATLGNGVGVSQTTETLVADIIARGRSVVEIDAGSRQATPDLGVSDLCAGTASFGDVVHRGKRSDFALVPWGQRASIDFASQRCTTLIEALADIFEVVMVDTGRFGLSSPLPTFAGLNGMVLLIVSNDVGAGQIEDATQDLHAIGFDNVQIARLTSDRAMVA